MKVGLITKEVEIILHPMNIKHFENLNYEIPKYINIRNTLRVKKGTIIKVRIEDLLNNSEVKVDIKCDCCGKELKNVIWKNYLKYMKEDGKYYCNNCAKKLYGKENELKSRLKNGKSFEQWCIENNRQDILDRWDYELNNNIIPSEILYATNKKYYFKCPRELHKSELKYINSFTNNCEGTMDCNTCNSFAQWGINNLGNDFLENYWDYKKNKISPWEISHSSNKYIWIKCHEKDYHESYPVLCSSFIIGNRCPYCINRKIHPLDSLVTLYPKSLEVWSDKNSKTPYEYAPFSNISVYWKCPDGVHADYSRKISVSNTCNFRCPECQYSKGEEAISNYFINKGFIKIDQYDFMRLIDDNKYNKNYYIPQKEFEGLVGLGGKSLFYDFYLPKYNLIIEYDGEYHFRVIKYKNESIKQAEDKFKKQQIHDMRKSKYAMDNDIQLIRIPYWEFDNIEKILERELNLQ